MNGNEKLNIWDQLPGPLPTAQSKSKGRGPWNEVALFLESPEKQFVKFRPAYSLKLDFSYVVKEIKIKITAKVFASRRFRFEDTKRIMSPEMSPKSFGTFEKRATGPES